MLSQIVIDVIVFFLYLFIFQINRKFFLHGTDKDLAAFIETCGDAIIELSLNSHRKVQENVLLLYYFGA